MNKTLKKSKNEQLKEKPEMNGNYYTKPSWIHNGCVRTDLPMTVFRRASKKKLMKIVSPGQLLCVGKVYLKTHNGLVQIKFPKDEKCT
jgi:hypothetical protein